MSNTPLKSRQFLCFQLNPGEKKNSKCSFTFPVLLDLATDRTKYRLVNVFTVCVIIIMLVDRLVSLVLTANAEETLGPYIPFFSNGVLLLVLGLFIALPMFAGNSYHQHWAMSLVAAVASLIVLVSFVQSTIGTFTTPEADDLFHYNQAIFVRDVAAYILLGMVLIFFLTIVFSEITKRNNNSYYPDIRLQHYYKLVARLLDPQSVPNFFNNKKLSKRYSTSTSYTSIQSPIDESEYIPLEKNRPEYFINVIEHPSIWSKFTHRLAFLFHCCQAPIKSSKRLNLHQAFETKNDFFYPQRLLFAFGVSCCLVLFLLAIGIAGFYTINGMLFEVWSLRYLNVTINNETMSQAIKEWTIDMANGNSTVPTILVVAFLRKIPDSFPYVLSSSVSIASLLAFVIIFLNWHFLFVGYRKLIMKMRRNKYPFDKLHYGPFYAQRYIGLQVTYCVISFICIIFFLVCVALFFMAIGYVPEIRNTLFRLFWKPILFEIIAVLYFHTTRCIVTNGPDGSISRPRLFMILDYIFMWLNLVAGFVVAVLKVVLATASVFINLARLDFPSLSGDWGLIDWGYRAYLGLALLDHYSNNPVVLVFTDMLMNKMKNNQIALESGRNGDTLSRKRARTRWHLFVMLAQNPSLKQLRKHALDDHKRQKFVFENEI